MRNPETRAYIDFWFDLPTRLQLTALAAEISAVPPRYSSLLWCAFSRLIITKAAGASLAMDVSHSRPHKVYSAGPIQPLERFVSAVHHVCSNAPFQGSKMPRAEVREGDARRIPFRTNSVDCVITSPPYLNAIDYLRGHRLSLVWMGHTMASLRSIRSTNIGTERGTGGSVLQEQWVDSTAAKMCDMSELPPRWRRVLRCFLLDMDRVMSECRRVLKANCRAVFVVGNSNVRGVYVRNSKAVQLLGERNGLRVERVRRRKIPGQTQVPSSTHLSRREGSCSQNA